MLQNIKAVQVTCMLFFCLTLAIRLFAVALPPNITHINNYPEFSITNWTCLLLTPIFYLVGFQLIRQYSKKRESLAVAMVYVVLFCIFILGSGIMSNFIATSNPSSSIIIYLVALIAVAGVYTLEYQETLLLTVVNAVLFTLLLLYVRADPTIIVYNELLLLVLLGIFFFVSRHIYSYRASHYLQYRIIKEKNTEIEKASSFKNEVLGMVAHDLRNPIGAIESIALLMEMDDRNEDDRENTGMIKTSCRKALSIINDLLEVARNDNSDEIHFALVNMNDFLKEMVQTWRHMAEFKNQLVLTVPNTPVHAEINQEKFHRVIDNLISNAAKFSKDKGIIQINLSQQEQHVVIEIKDEGIGIPPALLPNVFDRFSKAGRKGVNGEKSTGLGLSISRQIVEKHHGRIEVQSEEGVGSTFTIKLHQATKHGNKD